MNGTTVKGILFDFGGTLDTNGTHWGIVLQEAYRDAGFTLDEAAFREMYVQGERQLAARPVISDQDTFDIVLQKKLDLECAYGIAHGFLPDEPATRTRIAGIARHCYESVLENTRRAAELLRKPGRRAQTRPGHLRTRTRHLASRPVRGCRRGRQRQKRHRSRSLAGHRSDLAQRTRLGRERCPPHGAPHHR